MTNKTCRYCRSKLKHTFVDLGVIPLVDSFLKEEDLDKMEPFYPLHAYVCENCFLVQIEQFESPSHIFRNYTYCSSYSDSWLKHARDYVDMAMKRFKLTPDSQVIEVASNDGYLLQYFQEQKIPVLGIEPAERPASIAIDKGIPTKNDFFGKSLAEELVNQGYQGDVIVANNVLAHVPDLLDFIAGLKIILKPQGVITAEFPHLLQLMSYNQFDTIFHEHFSYFSLLTLENVFLSNGLKIFDVEEIPTHGGSLRIFVKHVEDDTKQDSPNVHFVITKEKNFGLHQLDTYLGFYEKVEKLKFEILKFFIQTKQEGKRIVGYGAPGKGITLLNCCKIGREFLSYTVDKNRFKQGLFLPGTRIPVKAPEEISRTKPDYVLILPWNLKDEIMDQMSFIRQWGGKFVVMIPEVEVI